jgi:hypothetical protein
VDAQSWEEDYKEERQKLPQPLLVSIRQHTSAYVSIRQDYKEEREKLPQPLLVSIRQHTSAYVRIVEHT